MFRRPFVWFTAVVMTKQLNLKINPVLNKWGGLFFFFFKSASKE